MRVAFVVHGRPRGKGRPRFNPRGGPPITPKATREAEKAIGWEFTLARRMRAVELGAAIPILTGTVRLSIEAVFRIPKGWTVEERDAAGTGVIKYTGKPDRDNILKLYMDALNGVAWVDDAQVNEGPLIRRYGTAERVEVVVEHVEAAAGLKSPAERAREAKVARGDHLRPKRKKRAPGRPTASELPAIGKRIR